MRFQDKVILVTGAGGGIGRATAIRFAREGGKVAVNSLTAAHGLETLRLLKEVTEHTIYIQGDVSKEADARRIVEQTAKAFNRLDILVNNAGISIPGRVDNMSEEDWDRSMAVNVKGVFFVSKYAIHEMRKVGGGAIVHISSGNALKGIKDRAAYTASKGAVHALTKCMAADYVSENIRVNCICPGAVDTPMMERRFHRSADPEKARADFIARYPIKRLGKPEEIAEAILFAASDEAAFMDGATIAIDGGVTI